MPAYTWNTGDQITAARLNSVAGSLAAVATSGAYGDLSGKPTIPSANPWEFRPESYGAVGNGTTDDTAAIKAAVAAAVAYAQANNYYAEVVFRPVTYLLSSPTTKGPYGNAQIPLPYIAGTGQKVTLVFRGVVDATAHPHWLQTTPQKSGTVLRTTLTGQGPDGTYKAPSVVGGPTTLTTASNLPDFSNMLFVVDGITITAPPNPSLVGFDLRQISGANIITAACLAEQSPAGTPNFTTIPTNGYGVGLYMPRGGNGVNNNVDLFTCYGYTYGVGFSDNFTARKLVIIYCGTAIFISQEGPLSHGAAILYASIEATPRIIDASGLSITRYPLSIVRLDLEGDAGGTTVDVIDTNNYLTGDVSWNDLFRSAPVMQGGAKLRITNQRTDRGALTAPSIPTSTTALVNPFWRDCAVTITGGTVTVITVDGQTLGVTSGTVFVPSGKTIAVTYSVAPAWKWTAL